MSGRPPLDGIRVLDFTRILAGPMCTMLLADLGAEVTKVERPVSGDDTRSWGPPSKAGDATYYLSVNRGKKSIVLDLFNPEDVSIAQTLAANADVVVENFRDGVMSRFGLDYETLRHSNPGLVYCSIPAYANDGEGRSGYDLLMQAACGLMSVTGLSEPTKTGVAVLDVVTGLYASTGIVSALLARKESGDGQHVVVGLFEASVAALVNQASSYLMGGAVPGLSGNSHPSITPYQLFHGSDAAFALAGGNDKLFRLIVDIVGLPHMAEDERYATNAGRVLHHEELNAALQREFSGYTAERWVERFEEAGVPASLVRTIDQVFASDEGRATLVEVPDEHRGALQYVRNPIQLSETALKEPSLPPPRLGEHTDEIIRHARSLQHDAAMTKP